MAGISGSNIFFAHFTPPCDEGRDDQGWAMVASQNGEPLNVAIFVGVTGCKGFGRFSLIAVEKKMRGYIQGGNEPACFSGIRGGFTKARATIKPIAARITT